MNERAERVERFFEIPAILAALLVVPVIVIEESSLDEPWTTLGAVANWLVWVIFAAELVSTTALADRRWQWLRTHLLELVIVVGTAPVYPASLQAARLLRLARVIRLLRLAKIARKTFSADGVRYAAVAAVLTVLGGGAAYAAVEGDGLSTWDGVWWAVTTMTTVGYGGSPDTDMGRAITIVVLAVGIGFVAFFTGAIAERFVRADVAAVADTEREIGETEADIAAELREIRERLQRLEARLVSRGA